MKTILNLFALVMAFGLFVACGGSDSATAEDGADATETVATNETDGNAESLNSF